MSVALYRKYRSKKLSEVVGQKHVTDVLTRALAADKIAHAYLLTGPRGVGKTSVARILAHEINGLDYTDESEHLDIIEIDAASNNGVDDVRELRDRVSIAPSATKYKVYIIDEVHMLSKPAFNALLKTLEEPPAHVVFILATTDADKLPATIISRTQRYTFRTISPSDVTKHLRSISDKEDISITDDALELVAERGDGSFRDSISLLDQISSLSDKEITREQVEQVLGLAPKQLIDEIVSHVTAGDRVKLIATLKAAEDQGLQPGIIATQLMLTLRQNLKENLDKLTLLDQLTEVSSAAKPDIKLLVTLLENTEDSHEKPKVSYAALHAPTPSVHADITDLHALEEEAVKEAPGADSANGAQSENPADFSWENFVVHAKEHYIAIASILSKCKHELTGTTLRIYTGNKLFKRKLDDTKYAPQLHACLAAIGADSIEVETFAAWPPIKNSQAAAVAAIMGGGEEVDLDE